ncbi:MAG: hypothetical protein HN793_03725 [Rhodospirillaceae bacterium]|jgi:hypothetical protein|nr:hypothetical protein [Rhodospirillaceae bacterium]MBT5564233.1 hypothetical protein [Rhodospirillaceae bacterium]MBT6088798.1 hypothetical protein [Rhodospirillaceae bacterium]MBT6961534.1 hypothetical protein [Rhodospirillaceae bacterium]MBT7449914.1 hypothetical protein [Rhodospirillaceae bacterium]
MSESVRKIRSFHSRGLGLSSTTDKFCCDQWDLYVANTMFQSEECRGFFEHWKSLRVEGDIIPLHKDFLDNPSPRYAPFVHISEISETGAMIVRLMGTGLVERWGRDKTGEAMGEGQPESVREVLYSNTRQVILNPCGLRSEIELAASGGSEMLIEAVTLPLIVEPGKPGRLVAYSALLRKLRYGEYSESYKSLANVEWVDIGAGIPEAPPMMHGQ